MEFLEPLDDDVISQIDFGTFFDDLPEPQATTTTTSPFGDGIENNTNLSSLSPDSNLSWIEDIENLLMNDQEDKVEEDKEYCDRFLADVLVDSPGGSGEFVDGSSDDKDTDTDDSSRGKSELENEKVDCDENVKDGVIGDGPMDKKLLRQLRNRDAAVRSRERKKMYVKDLETKSRYLEAECRRLGRLLQCFVAQNQALRLSLQNNSACGATMTKRESAVLLLETLPLVSLFWFLGIMCLFNLPLSFQANLEARLMGNAGKRVPVSQPPRGARSDLIRSPLVPSFISRGCKASRKRMKAKLNPHPVLVP